MKKNSRSVAEVLLDPLGLFRAKKERVSTQNVENDERAGRPKKKFKDLHRRIETY